MTVNELISRCGLKPLSLPEGGREVAGGYTGDLLSWVMGRAAEGDAWITIMSNINVVAVASLSDVACVILAEGVEMEQEVLDTAKAKGINLLSSEKPAYLLCAEIHGILSAK